MPDRTKRSGFLLVALLLAGATATPAPAQTQRPPIDLRKTEAGFGPVRIVALVPSGARP